MHTPPEGWTVLDRGTKAALSLFAPGQSARDLNDRSIVVHAAVGSEGVLLPGDLAVEGFEQRCAAGLPEPVTLSQTPPPRQSRRADGTVPRPAVATPGVRRGGEGPGLPFAAPGQRRRLP